MKITLFAGIALAAVVAASGASAQTVGWYGAIDGGAHWTQDIKASGASSGDSSTWKPDTGWMADGRVGYQFTPNWRAEAEVAFRDSKLHGISTPGGSLTSVTGTANAWSYMANVLYDFTSASRVSPFVGVGVGARQFVVDGSAVIPTTPAITVRSDDSDTKFAWQVLAGLAFKATDRLNIDVTYRYQDGDKPIWATTLENNSGAVQDHSVTVGLRYSFGGPATSAAGG